MTTTHVRSHTRRLPDKDRLKDLAFREEIEARKAEKSKRIKAPEDWYRGPGYPGIFRAIAAAFRDFVNG